MWNVVFDRKWDQMYADGERISHEVKEETEGEKGCAWPPRARPERIIKNATQELFSPARGGS